MPVFLYEPNVVCLLTKDVQMAETPAYGLSALWIQVGFQKDNQLVFLARLLFKQWPFWLQQAQ